MSKSFDDIRRSLLDPLLQPTVVFASSFWSVIVEKALQFTGFLFDETAAPATEMSQQKTYLPEFEKLLSLCQNTFPFCYIQKALRHKVESRFSEIPMTQIV